MTCEVGEWYFLTQLIVKFDNICSNQIAQKKAFETAKRRYAQGDEKSLQLYLKRWRAWAHGGLNDQTFDG